MSLRLEQLMLEDLSNNPSLKNDFHNEGISVLEALAKNLDLDPLDYSVHSVFSTPDSPGEVVLRATSLRLSIHQGFSGDKVMYDICDGHENCRIKPTGYGQISDFKSGVLEANIRTLMAA